jgi:IclR family pca regulon transcriptional regulator
LDPSVPTQPQDRSVSASFAKGLAILEAFDADTPAMTLAELARRTAQDRATARRGAMTLVQAGYLRQNGRLLELTPKVLVPAGAFLQGNRFGRLVQPVLNHHAKQLGAEITLATLDGRSVLLLAQSTTSDAPISYGFTAGSRLPVLHTSLGRMLLATLPQNARSELIQRIPLTLHTPQSLPDPQQISDQVTHAAETGLCLSDGEFEAGITGIPVPVTGSDAFPLVVGSSTASLGLSRERIDQIAAHLSLAAAGLQQAGIARTT